MVKKKKKQAFNFSLYKRNLIFLLNETVTISVMGSRGTPPRSLGIPSAVSAQPSSGLVYFCLQQPIHRNIFPWGLLSSDTAEQQEQRASVSASSHLYSLLPSPASNWQGNIKAQLFSSGQSNSKVWPPLNNFSAGLKTLPCTWSEASPWLGFCLSHTLTNFSWKHFPVSHLHRQSLSQTISERWIYSLYSFGL